MDSITIFVRRPSGQVDPHEVSGFEYIHVFAKKVLRKRECLIFENEDLVKKYSGLRIEDTGLYNQAELAIVAQNLREIFIPEGYLLFRQGKRYKHFVEPVEGVSLYKMLESCTLRCNSILPFDLIDQQLFQEMSIVKKEHNYRIGLNKKKRSIYERLCEEIRMEKTVPRQIQSDLFVHDEVYPEKIYVEELPNMKFCIDKLIIETGSVMVGGYPLSQFIPKSSYDVDIFSYTLDFLRLIIKESFSIGEKFNLHLSRFNNFDSYKIYYLNKDDFYINFIHINESIPDDLVLTPEENRARTMKFILDNTDFTAAMTCYDGEKVYLNRLTRARRSYFRLTDNRRHQVYSRDKRIELIPIPEVERFETYEWRGGYNYNGDESFSTKTFCFRLKTDS